MMMRRWQEQSSRGAGAARPQVVDVDDGAARRSRPVGDQREGATRRRGRGPPGVRAHQSADGDQLDAVRVAEEARHRAPADRGQYSSAIANGICSRSGPFVCLFCDAWRRQFRCKPLL